MEHYLHYQKINKSKDKNSYAKLLYQAARFTSHIFYKSGTMFLSFKIIYKKIKHTFMIYQMMAELIFHFRHLIGHVSYENVHTLISAVRNL